MAGYSFWGRGICQMLAEARVPYIAFDLDLDRLRVGELSRHNVHYGDVTDPTMMGAVAIANARAVVVTTSSFDDSKRMIDNLRRFYPASRCSPRSSFSSSATSCDGWAPSQVVALWPESTLSFGRSVLLAVGVPGPQVEAIVTSLQANDYQALRDMGAVAEEAPVISSPVADGTPRPSA